MGGISDFRRVFEEAHEAQLVLDVEGRLLAASDGYLRTVGCSRAEALERPMFELPPYARVPAAARALREAIETMRGSALDLTAVPLSQETAAALAPFTGAGLRSV